MEVAKPRHTGHCNCAICFLEALAHITPVLVAREHMSQYYTSFIDNEAAKHALVSGYGSVTAVN